MPIDGYFDVIFGVAGDLTPVPDDIQVDGTISYTQGFGGDYSLPSGNPARLFVPRTQTNQLFFDLTSAVQQYQQKGTPPFITTTMNGGSPFSYSLGDEVISGGLRYISLINSNTDTPPTANWSVSLPVNLGGTGVALLTAYAPIFGGTTSTSPLQSGTVGTAGQLLTSNGAGAIPTMQSLTSGSSILKGNGSGGVSNASAGTEYLAPAGNGSALTGITASQISNLAPFSSSVQTITAGGTLTIAHGLGANPTRVTTILVNTSAEGGYSVGNRLHVSNNFTDSSSGRTWGASIVADATNIIIRYANNAGSYDILRKDTGAEIIIDNTKWQTIFVASIY